MQGQELVSVARYCQLQVGQRVQRAGLSGKVGWSKSQKEQGAAVQRLVRSPVRMEAPGSSSRSLGPPGASQTLEILAASPVQIGTLPGFEHKSCVLCGQLLHWISFCLHSPNSYRLVEACLV
jgi:hypothetical protein